MKQRKKCTRAACALQNREVEVDATVTACVSCGMPLTMVPDFNDLLGDFFGGKTFP